MFDSSVLLTFHADEMSFIAVDSMVVFWSPEVKVGEAAAFQLSLTAPSNVDISCLPITSLAIHFSENFAPLIVRHVASNSVPEALTRQVDIGHVSIAEQKKDEAQTDLRWKPGSKIVFSGTLSSDIPITMNVRSLSSHQVIADRNVEGLESSLDVGRTFVAYRSTLRLFYFARGINSNC
jgi:hypothetical protein